MALSKNQPEFRVTETQRLIADAALQAVDLYRDENVPSNDQLVEHVARAMLVIEQGGLQAYFLKGFQWSCRARARREPDQVREGVMALDQAVDAFSHSIASSRGRAASRIRGNRRRRLVALERDMGWISLDEGQRRELVRSSDFPVNSEQLEYWVQLNKVGAEQP